MGRPRKIKYEMRLSPRQVIYYAAAKYLSDDTRFQLIDTLAKIDKLTDIKFVSVLQKHFDIQKFRDNPIVPQDIWLFNYLMYSTKKSENFNPLFYGEKVALKGKLPKKGLIVEYEKIVMWPQIHAILESSNANIAKL